MYNFIVQRKEYEVIEFHNEQYEGENQKMNKDRWEYELEARNHLIKHHCEMTHDDTCFFCTHYPNGYKEFRRFNKK